MNFHTKKYVENDKVVKFSRPTHKDSSKIDFAFFLISLQISMNFGNSLNN
jgi:hypothetical protein